jgi:hypothetical protein
MFERFTDGARQVVVLAEEEARMLNHSYIGTEHILLGLIHEGEGAAARALDSVGISIEAVRQQAEEIVGRGQQAPSQHISLTRGAEKVLELSVRESLKLGHHYIGTEHILLGLIRDKEGLAAQMLVSLGADLNRVRRQVIQLLHGTRVRSRWPQMRGGWSGIGWSGRQQWRRWLPGPKHGLARGDVVYGAPMPPAPEQLREILGRCERLQGWARLQGFGLDPVPEDLALLDEAIDRLIQQHGPHPVWSAVESDAGRFLGTVIVSTIYGARWRLWPNGYPVVRLASGRDLDVIALARDRLHSGQPRLAEVYANAAATDPDNQT